MSGRRAPRSLSLAVEDLVGELRPPTPLARVQSVWVSAVGATIAQAGQPSAERDGVLTVVCSDAVWSAELQMTEPELVGRLNAALGEPLIERLRCRTR